MAPTLFLIHGMWGKGETWGPFARFFRDQGYRAVTPTLRHHDVAPADPPPPALGSTSLLDYADDLEAEIKALAEPPIIIGHSMGGFLAQKLASRGLARGAIFLCPAPPAGRPAVVELMMPSVIRTLFGSLVTAGLTGRPHRLAYRQAVYSCLNLLPEAEARAEYQKWVHESGRALFEFSLWFLDAGRAAKVDPRAMACPTLTIAASKDRITPAPVVRRIGARYAARGGNFREYADHAHWIIGEPGWRKVAADCAAWIEMVAGPPAGESPGKAARRRSAKKRAAPRKPAAKKKPPGARPSAAKGPG